MDGQELKAIIEAQEWLAPAASIQEAVVKAYEAAGPCGKKLKNFLHGTWLGHPLHPVLTDIPLGAWSLALVLDGVDAARGKTDFAGASDLAVGVGLVGATGAAVTGLTDWSASGEQAPRVGLLHGVLNGGATVLYAASLLARRRGHRETGQVLSVLGFALVTTAAYLGGELVYGQGIGVDHASRNDLPERWTAVLLADELQENKPTRVVANEIKIVLVKQGPFIYALGDVCAHLGGPLSEGEVTDCSITCPWHGSRFDLRDGMVLDGPATFSQAPFETRVKDGQIQVRAA